MDSYWFHIAKTYSEKWVPPLIKPVEPVLRQEGMEGDLHERKISRKKRENSEKSRDLDDLLLIGIA